MSTANVSLLFSWNTFLLYVVGMLTDLSEEAAPNVQPDEQVLFLTGDVDT